MSFTAFLQSTPLRPDSSRGDTGDPQLSPSPTTDSRLLPLQRELLSGCIVAPSVNSHCIKQPLYIRASESLKDNGSESVVEPLGRLPPLSLSSLSEPTDEGGSGRRMQTKSALKYRLEKVLPVQGGIHQLIAGIV